MVDPSTAQNADILPPLPNPPMVGNALQNQFQGQQNGNSPAQIVSPSLPASQTLKPQKNSNSLLKIMAIIFLLLIIAEVVYIIFSLLK